MSVNGAVLSTASEKWASGLQSALVAKWSIIWAVISDKLYEAFIAGAFATPQSALEYFHDQWWILLVTGVMSIITGGYVRAQQKSNYIGRVENGTAGPPSVPVIVPPQAQVITPAAPPQGDKP